MGQYGGLEMGEMDLNNLIEMQTETDKKFTELQQKLVVNYTLRVKRATTGWMRS